MAVGYREFYPHILFISTVFWHRICSLNGQNNAKQRGAFLSAMR